MSYRSGSSYSYRSSRREPVRPAVFAAVLACMGSWLLGLQAIAVTSVCDAGFAALTGRFVLLLGLGVLALAGTWRVLPSRVAAWKRVALFALATAPVLWLLWLEVTDPSAGVCGL